MTGQPQPHPLRCEDNLVIMDIGDTLGISGNGNLTDDELDITYSGNHVFEIAFDAKKMSVVLKAEQTSIEERSASHSSAGRQQHIEHTGKLFIEVDHGKVKCTDGKYHDFQEHFYLFDVTTGDTIALLRAGDQHE